MEPIPSPGQPVATSPEPLPVRFWAEVDRAAGLSAARERGNFSTPAFHGVAPEQGALSQLPAEQGQRLVGQARALAKSAFAFSNDYRGTLAHAVAVLEGLPGGPAADAAEAKMARFLEEFDFSVRSRELPAERSLSIPAFKREAAQILLNSQFSPIEAAGVVSHFQAFMESPYGDVSGGDKKLLAELRDQTNNRLTLQAGGQKRIPIVYAEKGESYQIPTQGD